MRKTREIECQYCGAVFMSKRKGAKYCSIKCRYYDKFGTKAEKAKKSFKSYAEIRRDNRRRPIKNGWRGQVCLGGW